MAELNRVHIETDGGPWVSHNQPCAVFWSREHAVFDMDTNIFQPSWTAQADGWMTIQASGWRAKIIRLLSTRKDGGDHG